MKIAVLLYGHLRDFERCAVSLNQYLLSRYDCDVFIHTWDETDHNTATWHNRKSNIMKVDEEMKARIKELYSPYKLIIEHQQKYTDEKIISSKVVENFKFSTAIPHFCFYSMGQANLLRKETEKETGIIYDFVLVTRPDIQLKTALNIEGYLYQAQILGLDNNKCRYFAGKPLNSKIGNSFYINEPNDLLFFAKPSVIDTYIALNQQLDDEYMEEHCINVVSIYTAREIQAGLMPIPVSYSMGDDWTFAGYRRINYLEYQPFTGIKRFAANVLAKISAPVIKFAKAHPWINNN